MAATSFDITGDDREYLKTLMRSEKATDDFLKSVESGGKKIDDTFKEASRFVGIMSERVDGQKKAIAGLEKQYAVAKRVFDASNRSFQSSSQEEAKAHFEQRAQAKKLFQQVAAELADEKKGLQDLEKQYETSFNKIAGQVQKVASAEEKEVTILTQMRQIRQEMATLTNADGTVSSENLARYDVLKEKLSDVGTAYRRVQQEQKLLTTAGNATLAGIIQGITGVAGAFTAAQGVSSMFVKDNERLAAIQTKLQAAMSITIGLQQVSTALHSTSALRIGLLSKVTNSLSAANLKLSTSFVKMGASANVARVAATALMGTLTLGLSVAVTAAIVAYNKYSSEATKAAEATRKLNESAASGASAARSEFERLRQEWVAAGNDLKKKETLVRKNADAYNQFGVEINGVVDADNLFITNAVAFVESINKRAMATAAMELAAEKYKESMKKMLDADARVGNPSFWDKTKGLMSMVGLQQSGIYDYSWDDLSKGFANDASKKMKTDAKKREKEAVNLAKMSLGISEEARQTIIEAGGKFTEDIIEGSKKHWESIRNAQQKIMDASMPDSGAFKTAKKLRDEADKMLELWNKTNFKGEESNADKARKKAQKIVDQQQKIDKLLGKQALEKKRSELDLENEATQAEIKALKDGAEKKRRQREHDHKIEIETLERRKEDYIRAVILSEKELFDEQEELRAKQDKKYTKKIFDPTSVKVDTSQWNAIIGFTKQRQVSDPLKDERKAQNEYLQEYGSYQEKRLAITAHYAQLIDEAENKWEKSGLEKLRDKNLAELDNSMMASTSLWGQLFDRFADYTNKELQLIIDSAREVLDYVNSTPEGEIEGKFGLSKEQLVSLKANSTELAAAYDAIGAKQSQMAKNNPFIALSSGAKNLKKYLFDLKKAEADLSKAQEEGDKDAEEGAAKRIASLKELISMSKGDLKKAVGVAASYLSDIGSGFEQIGAAIGDAGVESFGKALSDVSGIAQSFAQDGPISAGITAVTTGLTAIFSSAAKYRAALKQMHDDQIAFAHDYKMIMADIRLDAEQASNAFSEDGFTKAIEALSLMHDMYSDFIKEVKRNDTLQYGRGFFEDLKTQRKEAAGLKTDLEAIKIVTRHKTWFRSEKSKTLKELYPELFEDPTGFNVNAAKALLNTNNQLNDEAKNQIQDVIDLYDKWKEAEETFSDYLSNTFGEIGDSLGDSIVSAFEDGTDAMENWGDSFSNVLKKLAKQMMQTIFFQDRFNQLEKDMTSLYEKHGDDPNTLSSKVTELLGGFFNGMDGLVGKASDWYENFVGQASKYGFDLSGDSKGDSPSENSLKGAVKGMSQETASVISGHMAGGRVELQEARIAAQEILSLLQSQSPEGFSDVMSPVFDHLTIITGIHNQQLNEQKAIKELTKEIKDLTEKIEQSNETIATNTGEVADSAKNIARHTEDTARSLKTPILK